MDGASANRTAVKKALTAEARPPGTEYPIFTPGRDDSITFIMDIKGERFNSPALSDKKC